LVEGSLAIKPPDLAGFLPRPPMLDAARPTFDAVARPTLDTRPPFCRSQTLPFRLPSYSAPYSPPSSAYSEHSPHSPASFTLQPPDGDDMAMSDALDPLPPPPPFKMPVRPLKLTHNAATGQLPPSPHPTPSLTARIPTPIHPFFPSTPSPHAGSGLSPHAPAWLLAAGHSPGGHHAMPSPIREDAVDAQLSKLSVGDHPMADAGDFSLASPLSDAGGSGANGLPPRTGRARSGAIATVNRRIFTGYVADCEKCRNKVPGHYIHFLPS
jgi:hypothetical protein